MDNELLRKALWTDMWGSVAAMAITIFGAGLVGGWLGVPTGVVLAVGITLIPWVVFLAVTSRRTPLSRPSVGVVIAGNLAWGIAAAIVLIGFPDALSIAGKWIVAIFSLAVVDIGVAEWVGLRRGGNSGASHATDVAAAVPRRT